MWLIGMMGSGKTTVGERVASRVGARFFDTDRMVVEMARMPIDEIWDEEGEAGFRELERRAVADVPTTDVVAAAGGGAVLDPDSRRLMTAAAPVVWLQCDPTTLATRLAGDSERPLLGHGEPVERRLSVLMAERHELYAAVATHRIDTAHGDVDETVAAVAEIWQR